MAHHLRELNAPEYQPGRHAVRFAGLDLAALHRHESTAESFAHIGPEDKADGDDTGGEGIEVDIPVQTEAIINRVGDDIEQYLAAKEQQQHKDQVGNAANHGGIQCGDLAWEPVA